MSLALTRDVEHCPSIQRGRLAPPNHLPACGSVVMTARMGQRLYDRGYTRRTFGIVGFRRLVIEIPFLNVCPFMAFFRFKGVLGMVAVRVRCISVSFGGLDLRPLLCLSKQDAGSRRRLSAKA